MTSKTLSLPQFATGDAELLNLLKSSGEPMKKQHKPLFRGDTRVVSMIVGPGSAQASEPITPPTRLQSVPMQAHAMLSELCTLLQIIDNKLNDIQTEVYALQHTAMEANEVATIGMDGNHHANPFLALIDQMISQHMQHHPTDAVFDDTKSLILRARKDAATISHLLSQYKVLSRNVCDNPQDSSASQSTSEE